MPHGHLTPLGRHLRSVLANLSQLSPNRHHASPDNVHRHAPCPASSWAGQVRFLQQCPVTRASAATATSHTPVRQADNSLEPHEDERRFRSHSRNRLHRRKRVDHLTEALKDVGNNSVLPYSPPDKRFIDLSYVNVKSRTAIRDFRVRQKRHANDPVLPPSQSRELSLQRILGSLLRHRAKAANFMEAEWNSPFELSRVEFQFLRQKGVTLDDISAWADIISTKDTLAAVQLLARRTEMFGPGSVPVFVQLYLLRRHRIGARALRLLLQCCSNLFDHLATSAGDRQPILIFVVRLLRHAREVWPQAMLTIVQMLLTHYQRQRDSYQIMDVKALATMSYFINRVMALLSLSTAAQPFKDNPHQETAMLAILHFMSQHNPPLHINRLGYRAVVRIQLAQRKTDKEQRWASLKALSWPPWKSDRTAMDSLITPADHGVSRAAVTLARMREAGYAFLDWEKTAQLYTGWDVDCTPTIQLRALLGSSLRRHSSKHLDKKKRLLDFQPWAARIQSTRTAQEAWACFLSWEDAKLPPDPEVFYVIMGKLREEDRRQRIGGGTVISSSEKSWPLLPGDSPAVSPLPPSTHLYTYTRTPPPSLTDFYGLMKGRGIAFEGHCVALLIHSAPTAAFGVRVLQDSVSLYPSLKSLLQYGGNYSTQGLPAPILAATLGFLARFAHLASLSQMLLQDGRQQTKAGSLFAKACDPFIPDDDVFRLNPMNSMTLALDILRTQPISFPPMWNTLLRGLTREYSLPMLGIRLIARRRSPQWHASFNRLPDEMHRHLGAIDAFPVVRMVINMMRERAVDRDTIAVHCMCLATENMAIGLWAVQKDISNLDIDQMLSHSDRHLERDVQRLAKARIAHSALLKLEFNLLVGQDEALHSEGARKDEDAGLQLPKLLVTPEPALLHAYIRALGWLGDYDGLLATLRWMRDHRQELVQRKKLDRNGQAKMRLAIIALRIFLERSWLDDGLDDRAEATTRAVVDPELEVKRMESRQFVAEMRRSADAEVIAAAKEIVDSVDEWQGWASDEEVESYIADRSFDTFRSKQ